MARTSATFVLERPPIGQQLLPVILSGSSITSPRGASSRWSTIAVVEAQDEDANGH